MKRIFDLVLSSALLLLFSPIILALCLLIYLKIGRPIFFCQERPGIDGEPFLMVKFRTMTDARDERGNLLEDKDRLTRIGKFLRSTSLDELPELYNVIKGEMSLVGPRPLLMAYLPLYSEFQARRHEVRPGVTGWAQVNGRNALSWEEKLALDVWYVENRSFTLDLRILWLTIRSVVLREGISADGEATMPPFTGNTEKVRNK